MSVASKLLRAIDEQMRADQGAAYKLQLRAAVAACEDAYTPDVGNRSHLGASGLGHECSRALWYGFRWVGKGLADARMIRIWNRGHLEEGRFVALLRSVGVKVWTHDDGKQFRVNIYGAHAGGSCDGASLGIPDCPTLPVLNEFKTHKDSSFNDLVRKGVRDSKPAHYIQIMLYMRRMWGLAWGLYMSVNKDTDALHAELIAYDEKVDDHYTKRAEYIVNTRAPPDRISNNPSWYICKFCDFREICHAGKEVARNCRTCEFAEIHLDGWHCGNAAGKPLLSKEQQAIGCGAYHKLTVLSHA